MADLATLQTRLTEAQAAYHRLLTGSQQEGVSHGEWSVTYSKADIKQLAAYIAQLSNEILVLQGTVVPRRRALIVDL